MKNIFITGSGRRGTSMLAGLFSQAGYFFGDKLYPPREANPKGFFERPEDAYMELVREVNSQLDKPEASLYSIDSGSTDAQTLIQSVLADKMKRQQDEMIALGRKLESTEHELTSQQELRREAEIRTEEFCSRYPGVLLRHCCGS